MSKQIRLLSAIVNKLSGISEYVSKEALLEAMSGEMAENGPSSLRTLQRNIKTIEEVFGIEIQNVRGKGYHIVGRDPVYTDRFKELLSEFEILSTVDSDSGTRGCIIPERNDVQSLINSNPSIKKVLLNGGKAYRKALDYGCLNVEMPSTSSANTHLTQEELVSIWVKEIKEK